MYVRQSRGCHVLQLATRRISEEDLRAVRGGCVCDSSSSITLEADPVTIRCDDAAIAPDQSLAGGGGQLLKASVPVIIKRASVRRHERERCTVELSAGWIVRKAIPRLIKPAVDQVQNRVRRR